MKKQNGSVFSRALRRLHVFASRSDWFILVGILIVYRFVKADIRDSKPCGCELI